MKVMSRRNIIIGAFLVIVAGAFFVERANLFSNAPPADFTQSRLQGAIISQMIIDLSNQSSGDLAKVDELNQKGQYADALNLTTEIKQRSADIRDRAVDLSNQVGIMTKSLSDISSFEARQAALESISSRLALLNRLISYSADIDQLSATLADRFNGKYVPANQISAMIDNVNAEVRAINNFNAQAGQSMDRFDKIVKN